jgi:hypothetical protein
MYRPGSKQTPPVLPWPVTASAYYEVVATLSVTEARDKYQYLPAAARLQ